MIYKMLNVNIRLRYSGVFLIVKINHQFYWWSQKALALRQKNNPPSVKMKKVRQPNFKTEGGTLLDKSSLAHTKWNCKYHVVFAPKYRRQAIYGKIKGDIGKILRKLCDQKGVEILEATACPDHVHMIIAIPPKYSVSSVMGYLKGKKFFDDF